jgi:uroporphyrin-III C-methyltransferase
LANEELLSLLLKKSIKELFGKKGVSFSQDEINQLIVDNALTYGNVVRLKGVIHLSLEEEVDKFGFGILPL